MAINLQFETGTYKEYQLNGGETISINISDVRIIQRLMSAEKRLPELKKKYEIKNGPDAWVEADKDLREIIDRALNCPGACDKAFGEINCLSKTVNGRAVVENFLVALKRQLKTDISAFGNASAITLDDTPLNNVKTQKYTGGITHSIGAAPALPFAAVHTGKLTGKTAGKELTDEQKAFLRELLNE